MLQSAVTLISRSEYGAMEIKKYISKATIKGFIVALSIFACTFSSFYFVKTYVRVVPKVQETPTIPIGTFFPEELKLPKLPDAPKLGNFKSPFVAGKYTAVEDDKLDPNGPDVATIDLQGTSNPVGGGDGINIGDDLKQGTTPIIVNVPDEIEDDKFIPLEVEVGFSYDDLKRSVVYPEVARKSGIEGRVIIKALIGKDGKVRKTKILESANRYLNFAAENAVLIFDGFSPAIQNQQTVEVWITIPIEFKIK